MTDRPGYKVAPPPSGEAAQRCLRRWGLEPRTDGLKSSDDNTGERTEAENGSAVHPKEQEATGLAQAGPGSDPVETAVARGLELASAAGEWTVVATSRETLKPAGGHVWRQR